MKNNSNLSSQSPASISSLSLGSASDTSIDMPSQLEDRLGCMQDDFSLFAAFDPDTSNTHSAMMMALDLGLGLEPLASLQALGLSTAQTSHPAAQTEPVSEALGKSYIHNYQDLSNTLAALYPDNSNTQSVTRETTDRPRIGLEPRTGLQALGLSTTFATQASSPTGSDSDSMGEGRNSRSCSVNATSETHRKTKRRLQNRQAQRRFRERKDEYLQALEKKTASLEKECQELLEKCNTKSEEAFQARKEVEILSRENEDLRKRWRLIVLLLSLPNKSHSPNTLLGNETSQLRSSTSLTEPAPASKDAAIDRQHSLLLREAT